MTDQTPSFQRHVPESGLTILHERRDVPPIDAIRIFFPGGSALESPEDEGLGYLTAQLMTRQTKKKDLYEFARFVDDHGLKLSSNVSADYICFSVTGTREFQAELLEIGREIVNHPAFRSDSFDRLRTQQLASIRQRADQSFPYAMDETRRAFYGDHPYNHHKYGRTETVEQFTPGDCERFAKQNLLKGPVVVSHVGGIPTEKLESLFENRDLKEGEKSRHPVKQTKHGRKTRIKEVDQPTHVLIYPAPAATTEQYVPIKLLNTLLGSGMSSILFDEMREKRSLGYQTGSSFPSRIRGSHFAIYLGGDAESNGETFRNVFEEITNNLAENGLTDKQLVDAKQHLKGNFLLDHETPGQRAWYRAFYETLGRTADFDRTFTEEVEKVGTGDIQKLVSTIFLQNEPLFLTVSSP